MHWTYVVASAVLSTIAIDHVLRRYNSTAQGINAVLFVGMGSTIGVALAEGLGGSAPVYLITLPMGVIFVGVLGSMLLHAGSERALGQVDPHFTRKVHSDLSMTKADADHYQVKVRYGDAEECQMIIRASYLPSPGRKRGIKNQITDSAARAGPNERLKTYFGVDNCFTSADSGECARFRAMVVRLLSVDELQWGKYAQAARMACRRELEWKHMAISLFDLVQMVTMKAMLMVLLHKDPSDASKDCDIRSLARLVNEQWLRSKNNPITEVSLL